MGVLEKIQENFFAVVVNPTSEIFFMMKLQPRSYVSRIFSDKFSETNVRRHRYVLKQGFWIPEKNFLFHDSLQQSTLVKLSCNFLWIYKVSAGQMTMIVAITQGWPPSTGSSCTTMDFFLSSAYSGSHLHFGRVI